MKSFSLDYPAGLNICLLFSAVALTFTLIYLPIKPDVLAYPMAMVFLGIMSLAGLLAEQFFKGISVVSSLISYILCCYCLIFLFACLYKAYGMSNLGALSHDHYDALYLSVITWTSVGYGDVTPCVNARWVSIMEALLSYLLMSILVAKIICIFQMINVKNSKHED